MHPDPVSTNLSVTCVGVLRLELGGAPVAVRCGLTGPGPSSSKSASWSVLASTLNARSIPGHPITVVGALKSGLWAMARGKGARIPPKTRFSQAVDAGDAACPSRMGDVFPATAVTTHWRPLARAAKPCRMHDADSARTHRDTDNNILL